MHNRVLEILTKQAKLCGWTHRGTLSGWNSGIGIELGTSPENCDETKPDVCTFWFHRSNDHNLIIGFDWAREKPDIVKGFRSYSLITPINITYTSSNKKLQKYFRTSLQIEKPKITPWQKFLRKLAGTWLVFLVLL